MIIPIAMAAIAIFIIGAEILLLRPLAVMSRLAMKYSKFKKCSVFVAALLRSKIQFSIVFSTDLENLILDST